MLLFALELQLDDWLAVKSKVPVNFSPGKPSTKYANVFPFDLDIILFQNFKQQTKMSI